MASYHFEMKSGKKGTSAEHSRYITRTGKHRNREDLVEKGFGNLPAWAGDDPRAFWNAADKSERKNGTAYREHIVALPNELDAVQQKELAHRLIASIAGERPFEYALHAPRATLGEAQNPHIHLMTSDRMPDGIARDRRQTFARYNAKYPERGGCRKSNCGRTPAQLRNDAMAQRKQVADIQNEMLAECGYKTRVDHRSNRSRGLVRPPEEHLGPARINSMTMQQKAKCLAARTQALAP